MTDSSWLSLCPVDSANTTVGTETRSPQKRPPFYLCQRWRTPQRTGVGFICPSNQPEAGLCGVLCEGQSPLPGGEFVMGRRTQRAQRLEGAGAGPPREIGRALRGEALCGAAGCSRRRGAHSGRWPLACPLSFQAGPLAGISALNNRACRCGGRAASRKLRWTPGPAGYTGRKGALESHWGNRAGRLLVPYTQVRRVMVWGRLCI